MDRSGRVVVPSGEDDFMRQPAYPGARIDRMGRRLESGSDTDTLGRKYRPGRTHIQPGLPKDRRERSDDDQEEKKRREGVHTMPHMTPHIPLQLYSGAHSTRVTPKTVSAEGKSATSTTSLRGTGSWSGKGILTGLGGVLVALLSALFGKKKDQGDGRPEIVSLLGFYLTS